MGNQSDEKEIASLKQRTIEMLGQVQGMFRTSFEGLMKHDINILNQVLKDEAEITKLHDDLVTSAIENSKKKLSKKSKKAIMDLTDNISTIEEIGDCCVGLVERIEYKIRENLLFSEAAVEEYKDLYGKVDRTLSGTIEVMKTGDKKLAKKILQDKPMVDDLVNKYRASHIERSARGMCDEWAKIRYLDMLDFIKEVAHYCMEVVDKPIEG